MSYNYKPTPSMRKNPLSKFPGGSTIIVNHYGYSVTYTNIKNVEAYLRKVKTDKTVKSIQVNGKYVNL